jgi:hypothetical protein
VIFFDPLDAPLNASLNVSLSSVIRTVIEVTPTLERTSGLGGLDSEFGMHAKVRRKGDELRVGFQE